MSRAGTGHAGRTELLRRLVAAWVLAWQGARGAAITAITLVVAVGTVPVIAAWLMKLLLDAVTHRSASSSQVILLVAGLAVGGLLGAALPHVQRYAEAQLRRGTDLRARDELCTAVGRIPGLARFEHPRFHDELRLAQQAGLTVATQVVSPSLSLVQAGMTTAGFLASLVLVGPLMAVLVPAAALPSMWAQLSLSRRRAGLAFRASPGVRRQVFYGRLLTEAASAKEVRLFGLSGFFRDRLLTELRAINGAERDLDRRTALSQVGLTCVGAACAAGGLCWAALAAIDGRLSAGDISVFAAALIGVQSALSTMVAQFATLHQALLIFGHYRAVVTAPPDQPVVARPVPALRDGIELRDVWFRYDEDHPWVLKGVDLRIPHGTAVALVGANGAGKSTLVKLLCRFYDPQRGSIRWDGVDIRELDPATLRARMAAVFQDHVAYDLTARENVGVGDLSVAGDPARVHVAAERAGAHHILAELPSGYDTMLSRFFFQDGASEKAATVGVTLSGGQWQRVALARAFMRDRADFLILDEPSSGLDAEATHALHETLQQFRAGRTTLLISHRLSAVRDAEMIVVLRDGQVIERGTHAELMAAGAEYARLFTLQADGYQHDRQPAGQP